VDGDRAAQDGRAGAEDSGDRPGAAAVACVQEDQAERDHGQLDHDEAQPAHHEGIRAKCRAGWNAQRPAGSSAIVTDAMDDGLTGQTVELLQQLIRNQCVNDGTVASGQEVRTSDVLKTYLQGSGLDLEVYQPDNAPAAPASWRGSMGPTRPRRPSA